MPPATIQTPAEQLRSMQLFSDLISLAAQQASAQGINPTDLGELETTIRFIAGAIAVTVTDEDRREAIAARAALEAAGVTVRTGAAARRSAPPIEE
jgi:hypothetical protein